MNTLLIVLPILSVLMFELGLVCDARSFVPVLRRPRALALGLAGQLLALPLLALAIGYAFGLEPRLFVGLVLIACSPGGSSSNAFSMLARGNVALSITLTAFSSLATLVTIPLVMQAAVSLSGAGPQGAIELPVGRLVAQNVALVLLPVAAGFAYRRLWPASAGRLERALSRLTFPALLALVAIFFAQNRASVVEGLGAVGASVAALVAGAMLCGAALARLGGLSGADRRTVVIEVAMQNAAQAIAVATSPFIFADNTIALPPIVYSLLMNVALLAYVRAARRRGA